MYRVAQVTGQHTLRQTYRAIIWSNCPNMILIDFVVWFWFNCFQCSEVLICADVGCDDMVLPARPCNSVDGKSKLGKLSSKFQVCQAAAGVSKSHVPSINCWRCLLSTWSRTYNSIFPESSQVALDPSGQSQATETGVQNSNPHQLTSRKPPNGPTIVTNPKWMIWHQETDSLHPTDKDPLQMALSQGLCYLGLSVNQFWWRCPTSPFLKNIGNIFEKTRERRKKHLTSMKADHKRLDR